MKTFVVILSLNNLNNLIDKYIYFKVFSGHFHRQKKAKKSKKKTHKVLIRHVLSLCVYIFVLEIRYRNPGSYHLIKPNFNLKKQF